MEKKLVVEELERGFVRITATGGTLVHKPSGRTHSEAVVKPESVKLFKVV